MRCAPATKLSRRCISASCVGSVAAAAPPPPPEVLSPALAEAPGPNNASWSPELVLALMQLATSPVAVCCAGTLQRLVAAAMTASHRLPAAHWSDLRVDCGDDKSGATAATRVRQLRPVPHHTLLNTAPPLLGPQRRTPSASVPARGGTSAAAGELMFVPLRHMRQLIHAPRPQPRFSARRRDAVAAPKQQEERECAHLPHATTATTTKAQPTSSYPSTSSSVAEAAPLATSTDPARGAGEVVGSGGVTQRRLSRLRTAMRAGEVMDEQTLRACLSGCTLRTADLEVLREVAMPLQFEVGSTLLYREITAMADGATFPPTPRASSPLVTAPHVERRAAAAGEVPALRAGAATGGRGVRRQSKLQQVLQAKRR